MQYALVKGFFLNFFVDFLVDVSNETRISTDETLIFTERSERGHYLCLILGERQIRQGAKLLCAVFSVPAKYRKLCRSNKNFKQQLCVLCVYDKSQAIYPKFPVFI